MDHVMTSSSATMHAHCRSQYAVRNTESGSGVAALAALEPGRCRPVGRVRCLRRQRPRSLFWSLSARHPNGPADNFGSSFSVVASHAASQGSAGPAIPGTLGDLRSFEEARDHVWRLGLRGKEEWWEWERSGQRPRDIPSHPDRVYRDEWESWDDWLGVGKGGQHVEDFLGFEDAREYVRGLSLKNLKEWMLWSGSGKRPANIPWAPDHTYKDQWESWEDWLG
mmetsp:Transcript_28689/g.80770  ORF Transcript_28689/g.80770 Transcript_28689/m.80770 type:complete len:223 (+) Transcript_28689:417-1085(+)